MELGRQFGKRRIASELSVERCSSRPNPPRLDEEVGGQANSASVAMHTTLDTLSDPEHRVRRELVAERVVELLYRAAQTDVAVLDRVEQIQRPSRSLGHRDDQTQV